MSRTTTATRLDLPQPSIDTGMGLERIAAVLQGVHDNYDTDTFKALIARIERADRAPADGATAGAATASSPIICAPSGFLIADGVLPSNEGRGYVLRRIMRRAMRHAHLLGAKEPLMHRLVPALVAEMGAAYPELVARPAADRGDAAAGGNAVPPDAGQRPEAARRGDRRAWRAGDTLPGETAFKLYDTFGFPYDLTEDALRAQGHGVDRAGFDAAMAEQKARRARRVEGHRAPRRRTKSGSTSPSAGRDRIHRLCRPRGRGRRCVALVRDGAQVDARRRGRDGR